ncbi:MAG: aromatic acid exporter family protein [Turicibacter sp.]|nr:aromatic acid exporter family protein [Turicibacter sp.]
MKHRLGMRTIKTAIGATLAILLADWFGLKYALSAGIITVLSVQNTKRKSVEIALLRLNSTLLALGISSILFLCLGFNPIAFGIYLLIFIPTAVRFNLSDGIVVSSVLVTHLLGEGYIDLSLLFNELLLMFIGAGIAILFNLYMPKMIHQIKKDQDDIEEHFRTVLFCLANTARSQSVSIDEEVLFSSLAHRLTDAKSRADQHRQNYFLDEMTYYAQYMEMRMMQYRVLMNMRTTLGKVRMTVEQSIMLADLTDEIAISLHEFNTADKLVNETQVVLEKCRNQALPQTREEFENRAMLFQYLNDVMHLLEIKRQFIANLTAEQRHKFNPSALEEATNEKR